MSATCRHSSSGLLMDDIEESPSAFKSNICYELPDVKTSTNDCFIRWLRNWVDCKLGQIDGVESEDQWRDLLSLDCNIG